MAIVIRMPEVLAGANEAVLANWLIDEGTEVEVGDVLAEIETEKATVEYESEEAGTLAKVLIAAGDAADVGAPIAVFSAPGDSEEDVDQALASAGAVASKSDSHDEEPQTAAQLTEESKIEVSSEDASTGERHQGDPPGRIFVSPLVRKLARDKGIDLSLLSGSGPGGRIVRKDFDQYLLEGQSRAAEKSGGASVSHSPTETGFGDFIDEPHSGMRRAIARRLTESKSSVPHFYLTAHCNVDRILVLRREVNEARGLKISLNDWIVKAVGQALVEVPDANVVWREESLRKFSSSDVAVAVATEGGLLTPVVRGVDKMTLTEVSSVISDLASRSRDGKIRQDEIEGGSFAVTNLGMFGIEEFSAILNPPQSGILAVGAATQRPVIVDGEIRVANMMTVTLSADHRAVDGALAAAWVQAFRRLIENPAGLLLP